MIDRKTARRMLEDLSVTIAGLLEDADEVAVRRAHALADFDPAARELGSAATDVAALAAAMQVIVRRSQEALD